MCNTSHIISKFVAVGDLKKINHCETMGKTSYNVALYAYSHFVEEHFISIAWSINKLLNENRKQNFQQKARKTER